MKLSALIKGCDLNDKTASVLESWDEMEITAISSRAQEIKPGGLFLAVRGYAADGHQERVGAGDKGPGCHDCRGFGSRCTHDGNH